MFTLNQTFTSPLFFRKGVGGLSRLFCGLLPLLLVCFVTFSDSASAQTKKRNGYSDHCGCGSDRECWFQGPEQVCPGSYATFCIKKKVRRDYKYEWSVYGDGCYVPSPSDCKYSCVTIRAKYSCWASYTVRLKIKNRYGRVISRCKKVVWVGDKEKPTVKPAWIAKCYSNIYDAKAAAVAVTRANAWDNCTDQKYLKVEAYSNGYECDVAIYVTVTDKCWNKTTVVYYTRIDYTAPICYTTGPIGSCYKTKAEAEDAARAATFAHDNCTPDAKIVETVSTVGDCSATITVRETDECGYYCESVYYTRIDYTAPVLYGCPSTPITACQAPALPTVTASDNCDGNLGVITPVITTVGNVITRTWTATDKCGNSAFCQQVITLTATTAPVLSGCPTTPVYIQCLKDIGAPATVTATDICTNTSVPVTFTETQTYPGSNCNNTVTRTWSATNAAGTTTCTQIIYVNDVTAPVFYNCPDKKIVIRTCDNETLCDKLKDIYATDNCGGDVWYKYKIKEFDDDYCDDCDYNDDENGYNDGRWDDNYKFKCYKKYIVVIKAIDNCGNVSKCRFKVIVKRGKDCEYNSHNAPIASRPTNTGKPEVANTDNKVISVKASPMPYKDKIRFVINSQISGTATLDVYSQLGQKLTNVYKGNVQAGRSQIVDFNVPASMRINLIYRLQIGNRHTGGTMLRE